MTAIPKTMKALVAHSKDDYRIQTLPVPIPGPGETLVKVEACGICAGDVKARHGAARFWGGDGMPGYAIPPFTPGHEFLGEIVALGEGAPLSIGDRIVSEQIVPCGHCRFCKEGKYSLCPLSRSCHADIAASARRANIHCASRMMFMVSSNISTAAWRNMCCCPEPPGILWFPRGCLCAKPF